jgi:hypothetical protein
MTTAQENQAQIARDEARDAVEANLADMFLMYVTESRLLTADDFAAVLADVAATAAACGN